MSDPAPADPRPAREAADDAARLAHDAASGAARDAARRIGSPEGLAASPQDLDAQARAAMRADAILLERTTPGLFEVGTWVFGGLTAFNILLISALITVGPVDTAILVSITAFACALPLTWPACACSGWSRT